MIECVYVCVCVLTQRAALLDAVCFYASWSEERGELRGLAEEARFVSVVVVGQVIVFVIPLDPDCRMIACCLCVRACVPVCVCVRACACMCVLCLYCSARWANV